MLRKLLFILTFGFVNFVSAQPKNLAELLGNIENWTVHLSTIDPSILYARPPDLDFIQNTDDADRLTITDEALSAEVFNLLKDIPFSKPEKDFMEVRVLIEFKNQEKTIALTNDYLNTFEIYQMVGDKTEKLPFVIFIQDETTFRHLNQILLAPYLQK